jgi:N-acetylneuraminic acid mutarotase
VDPAFLESFAWDGEHAALIQVDDDSPQRTGAALRPAVLRWTLGDSAWTTGAAFPLEPRSFSGVSRGGRRVAFWGGTTADVHTGNRMNDPPESLLADGAIYDVTTDQWQVMAPSPLSAQEGPAVVWNAGALVIGGGGDGQRSCPCPILSAVAAYRPETDTWARRPRIPGEAFFFGDPPVTQPYEGMSGPEPRWVLLGDEWMRSPFPDVHRVEGRVVTTSNTSDGDTVAFTVAVLEGDAWMGRERAPFGERRAATVVSTGDRLIVVGGETFDPRDLLSDTWILDLDD